MSRQVCRYTPIIPGKFQLLELAPPLPVSHISLDNEALILLTTMVCLVENSDIEDARDFWHALEMLALLVNDAHRINSSYTLDKTSSRNE